MLWEPPKPAIIHPRCERCGKLRYGMGGTLAAMAASVCCCGCASDETCNLCTDFTPTEIEVTLSGISFNSACEGSDCSFWDTSSFDDPNGTYVLSQGHFSECPEEDTPAEAPCVWSYEESQTANAHGQSDCSDSAQSVDVTFALVLRKRGSPGTQTFRLFVFYYTTTCVAIFGSEDMVNVFEGQESSASGDCNVNGLSIDNGSIASDDTLQCDGSDFFTDLPPVASGGTATLVSCP